MKSKKHHYEAKGGKVVSGQEDPYNENGSFLRSLYVHQDINYLSVHDYCD